VTFVLPSGTIPHSYEVRDSGLVIRLGRKRKERMYAMMPKDIPTKINIPKNK
jgi:hypothetical protein